MMGNGKIRILLVDDHAMVREGLHAVLAAQPDMDVVGEAANGTEALAAVRREPPDIVLMDITMPGMSGIEATQAIVAMGLGVKVLGLTVHENPEYFFRMLAAGASGYVLKGATSAELVATIRAAYQGGIHLSSGMASFVLGESLRYREKAPKADDEPLTPREVDVLKLIADSHTNQEVADALGISVYTVQTHRASIMRKLGLDNRHQLLKYALRRGYTTAE